MVTYTATAEAEYRRLVAEFLPRVLKSRQDLDRAEAKIGDLLAVEQRTPAQDSLLDLLTILVKAWEDQNVQMPQLEPLELLKLLCAERGLRQKDLVPIFGAESIVSEVFSGKRRLQTKHVSGLAAYFHVSPAVFVPVEDPG
ncbi:MAG TPA: transcriptional regulator [Dehalococcoidia bacterium]|nr:transcriptional regulator [Dehalococcoidia bacterium]